MAVFNSFDILIWEVVEIMNIQSEIPLNYLKLLSEKYPNIPCAKASIISLSASLQLPKPTEHFVSDLHGQYKPFSHILRNASGVFQGYIKELFPDWTIKEQKELATLVYYPKKKLNYVKIISTEEEYRDYLKRHLYALVTLAKRVAAKYDYQILLRILPEDRKSVLGGLLLEEIDHRHKAPYIHKIIETIINCGEAEEYIADLASLTRRFAVAQLHVIGDVYDRGNEPDKIMDTLCHHHHVDIQWGNHDILWIAAQMGSMSGIANVLRIASRNNTLKSIEDGYGININPLIEFAHKTYRPSRAFYPRRTNVSEAKNQYLAIIQKAIAIIQFKIEANIIHRHPEYEMEDMLWLDRIDYKAGEIEINGKIYPLRDCDLPTVDPNNPNQLTDEEKMVCKKLIASFTSNSRLRNHIKFLIDHGNMYKKINNNLLFHGCIPLDEDYKIKKTTFLGKPLGGKELLDELDRKVRQAFYTEEPKERARKADLLFYLWCGPDSPLSGKRQIATFNRLFIEDESTHKEPKNPYYEARSSRKIAEEILADFDMTEERDRIINGHTPVKRTKGEVPIRADGKVLVIDGGFAPSYHYQTKTAGYTLISNSYGIYLATHTPLPGEKALIEDNVDITSKMHFVEEYSKRRLTEDSDYGKEVMELIRALKALVEAYKTGKIRQK